MTEGRAKDWPLLRALSRAWASPSSKRAQVTLITPSAYGDRSKLTKAIHRQYCAVFPAAASRELVLFALARALLGSEAYYASLWERRSVLAGLSTSMLWRLKDRAFPRETLERLSSALPAATVVTFPASGHWPQEEEPEAFAAALRRALVNSGSLRGGSE